MASQTPQKTPLHDWHVAHKARMVDFAGWSMPVQYTSILEEHRTTRAACGLADISHMGRLRFEGPGAPVFLAQLLTRRVKGLGLNQIRYSLLTNHQGGILDDVLVGYYHNALGQPFYMLVVNAGNREKIVRWIHDRSPGQASVDPATQPPAAHVDPYEQAMVWSDVTRLWAMFAIQGPRSADLLQPLVDVDLHDMKYYNGAQVRILHPAAQRQGGIISRTGYTGEDGFELSVGARIAVEVWEALLERGKPLGAVPTGIGARDTLRLEAGMPLYGHELTENTHPFQAGLGYTCHLTGYDFPGRNALKKLERAPLESILVGLELEGRRPARQHCEILVDGKPVGHTTSGTYSPSLDRPIALGYVAAHSAEPGTPVAIDIRGRLARARVVELPFYRRERKGKKP